MRWLQRALLLLLLVGLPAQGWPRLQAETVPPFRKVWEASTKEPLGGFLIERGTLCFGTLHSYGVLELKTGKRRWEKTFAETYFSTEIARAGETLYVSIGKGHLLACELKTGRTKWNLPLHGYSRPMQADGQGTLFCEHSHATLTALDTNTRKARWKRPLSPPGKAPRPDDQGVQRLHLGHGALYVATEREILCLDPKTGAVRWRTPAGSDFPHLGSFATTPDRVYATLAEGTLLALDAGTGRRIFQVTAEGETHHAPVLLGDLLLFSARDGFLYAVQSADGSPRWKQRLSRSDDPLLSRPAIRGGNIYVSADERLFAFDPAGNRKWDWATGEDLVGEPIHWVEADLLLTGHDGFYRLTTGAPPGRGGRGANAGIIGRRGWDSKVTPTPWRCFTGK